MNKKNWFIPILIVALNALAIALQWSTLPEVMPAHYDLEGNAGGTMPRTILLLYPLIGAALSGVSYLIARFWKRFEAALVILSSGICLVIFCSAMVSLTAGKVPAFMLAEPVILLAAIVAAAIKARKRA